MLVVEFETQGVIFKLARDGIHIYITLVVTPKKAAKKPKVAKKEKKVIFKLARHGNHIYITLVVTPNS